MSGYPLSMPISRPTLAVSVQGISQSVHGFLGPMARTKLFVDHDGEASVVDTVELLQALDGSNPAVTLVRTTVLGRHAHAGNGATTLCALIGLLTRVATDLQRMGHTTRWIVAALHAGASVCERTCEELAMPLQSPLPEALHTARGLPTDGSALPVACGYIGPELIRNGISVGTERGGAAPAPPHASAATTTIEGPEPADSGDSDEFDWYLKAQPLAAASRLSKFSRSC